MTRHRKYPPRDVFPTDEEVVQLAYQLCASDSNHRGGPANYLRAAEDELLDRAFRRIAGHWGQVRQVRQGGQGSQ